MMGHLLCLEVVVNAELGALGEARLGPVVVVAKVVAVAGGHKGEAKGVVGRRGAAVRGPVDSGRILRVAAAGELRQCDAEEQLVGHSHVALAPNRAARHGAEAGRQQEDGTGELHSGRQR
jgi:hypothetical protein